MEAVKTNILGTNNLLTLGKKHNIKKLIVLSTDKAAYPINAMGMSKALMEKLMISNSRDLKNKKTIFVVQDMVMLWLQEAQLFHYLLIRSK